MIRENMLGFLFEKKKRFPQSQRCDVTGGLTKHQKLDEKMANTVIMDSLGARSSYGWTCA